jgi:hypothetical protein
MTVIITTMFAKQKVENIREGRYVKLTRKEKRRGAATVVAAHQACSPSHSGRTPNKGRRGSQEGNHGINHAAGGHHCQHREASEEHQKWRFHMLPETGCVTFLSHKLQRDFKRSIFAEQEDN